MKNRINTLRKRIRQTALACGRDPDNIRLVAVSKTVVPERIKDAVNAGLDTFGENYIQEAMQKIDQMGDNRLSWHFIGHLQSNKAKYAVRYFDLIHSVDTLKLAQEIDRQARKHNKVQNILVQVNVGKEASKSGTATEEALALIQKISTLDNLSVLGLMTMPPFFDQPERVRPFFKTLRQLRDRIAEAAIDHLPLKELSMGMTGDFETAIEEGATLVRIGTAIFGGRS